MYTKIVSVVLILISISINAQEVVKWIDENGKTHYGDKVPDQYRNTAEKVETDISVVSPEQDVSKQNRQHVRQLKREDKQEDKQKARQDRQSQLEDKKITKGPNAWPRTREDCRNVYVKRVKARTECFEKVDQKNK